MTLWKTAKLKINWRLNWNITVNPCVFNLLPFLIQKCLGAIGFMDLGPYFYDRPSSRDLVHGGGVHGPGILVLSSSKKQVLLIFRSWTALLPSFNTNCVRENAVLFEVLCIYLWTHGHLDVDDNTLARQKIFRGKWRHLQALHKAGSPKLWIDQSGFKRGNFTVLAQYKIPW